MASFTPKSYHRFWTILCVNLKIIIIFMKSWSTFKYWKKGKYHKRLQLWFCEGLSVKKYCCLNCKCKYQFLFSSSDFSVTVILLYIDPWPSCQSRDAPVQISGRRSRNKWALWKNIGRCRRQLSQSEGCGPQRPPVEQPRPRCRRSAATARRKNWVNIAVCLCLHPSLTYHRNINPFENKVWEIHIFIKKCVRSFIHWSSSLSLLIFIFVYAIQQYDKKIIYFRFWLGNL